MAGWVRQVLVAFALATFVLASGPAAGQVVTAEVTGSVVDESGAVLPGVSVTARNTETGFERTAVTDKHGRFMVLALSPGVYTIRAELTGFATQSHEGLTLTINQSVALKFTLNVASVMETVVVTGDAPLVQVTKAALGKTIDTTVIDALPLDGRNFTELASLAAGVKSDGGRLSMGGQVSANLENTSYSVDGIDNNNDVIGGRPSPYSQDAIREFQVLTNQFSAEFGRASGGVVNIITRSGTNKFAGRGFYFLRDEALDATPMFARSRAPFRRQQFGGTLGGPVVKDRTHYFGSVEWLAEDRISSVVTPRLRADITQPTRELRTFGKLTHESNSTHSLQLSYNHTRSDAEGLGIGGRNLPTNGYDRDDQSHIFILGHTAALSPTALNEFRFSIQRTSFRETPLDPIGPEIRRPSTTEGRRNNQPGRRIDTRYQFTNSHTRILDWGGNHSFKAGADVSFYRGYSLLGTFFGGVFTFTTDRPFDANDLSTYPVEYTVRTGALDLTTPNNLLAFYLTDNWRPHRTLTFNVGLRYDLEVGSVHNVYETDTNNVAPRVGFTWAPFDDTKTVVRGGYGRFYDQIFLVLQQNQLRAGAPPPLGVGITRTIVVTNPGYPDPFSRPTTAALEDGAITDGREQSPYTNQITLGISRQLGQTMAVSADYVRVRGHHITRNFDFNAVDPVTGVRPRPEFGRLYSYDTSGRSWYDALQASFEKRLSHGHQVLVSYTLSKSIDDIWPFFTNGATSFPQSYFHVAEEKGFSDFDDRHRLVASGIVRLPLDFQLGAILTTHSGRPYLVTTGRDNNRDGNLTDRPNFVPNAVGNARYVDPGLGLGVRGNAARNAERGTSYASLDLRLSKLLRVAKVKLELLAEAFNVTNRVNYSRYQGNMRSALFLNPIAAFDPRQIQFGARVDF